ncbi:MAG: DUF721 domain-containing protein [Methylocystis sp.]|nr:DUF721 domain-containing protein [Methylocystis sp.]MBI3274535.1 DUF721 domain-containing protein [Methylocystis sp.]
MSISGAGRPKQRSRPLADLVNRALDPLVARQGFAESSLLVRWEAIIGARIAAMCRPIRLQWPPRAKSRAPDKREEPAILVLRVEPGFGLDIQHMSDAIVARVNAHLGWRCVGRIAIRQEPLGEDGAAPRKVAPPDAAARAKARAATEGVTDEALRAALIALGERALAGPVGDNPTESLEGVPSPRGRGAVWGNHA